MKLCKRCGQEKPLTEFYSHKSTKDRRHPWCKACQKTAIVSGYRNNPTKHAAYNREWSRKNPHLKADYALKTRLGLPHGTYARLLAGQRGLCAICRTDNPGSRLTRFHVDHDAATGKTRGLLCERCNRGIGSLQHDVAILREAITYLNLHDQPKAPVLDAVLSILAINC
jgi:hypothetical protein